MSAPVAATADADRRHAAIDVCPVLAWLALQMLVLLAAGFRIPFAARFIVPEEQLALHEMFAVQMIASALLFPILLRNRTTAALVIASTPLMTQIAGIIAAKTERLPLVAACAYPTLWVIGLACWAYALRGGKARLYGVTAATLLVVGGVLVAYLNREFGPAVPSIDWASRGWLGPLMGGIALVEAGERTGTAWGFMGLHLLAGGLAAGIRWRHATKASKTVKLLV